MKPCISQATTMSTSFEADLEAYAQCGWAAVEIWLTKLETYLQSHTVEEARGLLDRSGLVPAAAAGQGGLLLSREPERAIHWDLFRRRLDLLHALGVPRLVVAVDFFARDLVPEDYTRSVASMVEAAHLAQAAGVTLAFEFQKNATFCASLDTMLALIAQSGATGLGVCLDLFHYYTGPSKFEDLAYLTPENLAWVQISDLSGTPRELAGDSDRIFPGEGDFQIEPILDHLGRIGYDGYVSLEVLNPQLWAIPVDRVADAGLRATARTLGRWLSNAPEPQV
ncbi:sugar phosphate isomerase/epimerase family protein [Tundrisphaera sp. TA3]|uniref:sugar phosphate isomerase/epimerase family protein n=1 Tax=Tundrisphaera sp. TA3 TaxID=3435775 RepID=UPI003EC0AB42